MPGWDPFLTEQDKAHMAALGPKQPSGFGEKPCVLVIDDYYSVLGFERQPILESIRTWPGSAASGLGGDRRDRRAACSARKKRTGDLLPRHRGLPQPLASAERRSRRSMSKLPEEIRRRANEIVEEIAPQPGEVVIKKSGPSIFAGTALSPYLRQLGIDTLIACGETTSGCVRASVVDGFTERFRMGVVEECCFDRTQASHWINLFDMHQKYADVIKKEAAIRYMDSIAEKNKVAVAAVI